MIAKVEVPGFILHWTALVFLLFVLATAHGQSGTSTTTETLRQLHVLYRHGDRTPIYTYPNDPYANYQWPAGGLGYLTNAGKVRAYNLGLYLRQTYGDFMGTNYNPKEIYVRSTDVDRTLMTSENVIAGLFPPSGEQVWNDNLAWQPIPVHTTSNATDWLQMTAYYCPRLATLEEALVETPKIQELNKQHRSLMYFVGNHSGSPIPSFEYLVPLYDTLLVQDQNNLTLPNWTNTIYPHPLRELSDYTFSLLTETQELKMIRAGSLLQDMTTHFRNRQRDPNYKCKTYLYGGHDTTVAPFLSSLQVFNGKQPPYCAAVIVELHEMNKVFFVRLLYRNDSETQPQILKLPDCPQYCPLERFLYFTAPIIPQDIQQLCQVVETTSYAVGDRTKDVVIAVLGVVGFLLLFVVLILCKQNRKVPKEPKAYDNEGMTIN